MKGALAVTSVGLWNGCFNSIQVVCRERNIIKREHRSGMHITSYIFAHMVYQFFLCLLQTVTTIVIFMYMNVKFPHGNEVVTVDIVLDFGITLLLITYAADMMSLFISCVAKNTTAAMTIMPLVLMVQLVFSGGMFTLPKGMEGISKFMISNHGMAAVCAHADYNSLPSSSGWTMIKKIADSDSADPQTKLMIAELEAQGYDEVIKQETAKSNFNERYVLTEKNIKRKWSILIGFAIFFACCAVFMLRRIDKDKR